VCLFCKESFGALIAKRAVLDFPLPNALKRWNTSLLWCKMSHVFSKMALTSCVCFFTKFFVLGNNWKYGFLINDWTLCFSSQTSFPSALQYLRQPPAPLMPLTNIWRHLEMRMNTPISRKPKKDWRPSTERECPR
jgi:hypothetical protein